MIDEADRDGDGEVNEEEFIRCDPEHLNSVLFEQCLRLWACSAHGMCQKQQDQSKMLIEACSAES